MLFAFAFLAVNNLGCLRTVPTNSKVFLRGFLTIREKQILTSAIEIQTSHFSKIINQQYL